MKFAFAFACALAAVEAYTNESMDNKKCFGKKVDLKEEPIERTLFFVNSVNKHPLGEFCKSTVEPTLPEQNYECVITFPKEGEYFTKVNWRKHECYQKDQLTGLIDENVTFQYYEVEELFRSENIEKQNWNNNKSTPDGRFAYALNWLAENGFARPGRTVEEEMATAKELADLDVANEGARIVQDKIDRQVNRWTQNLKAMKIAAYQECWSNAKSDYHLDLYYEHQPSGFEADMHQSILDESLEQAETQSSLLPKKFSTSECNSLRAQAFNPEEEGAIFNKLQNKLDMIEQKGYVHW